MPDEVEYMTNLETESAKEIVPPPSPSMTIPQTFKCEKCGAAYDDEGAAAAHIQLCKGPDISDNLEIVTRIS